VCRLILSASGVLIATTKLFLLMPEDSGSRHDQLRRAARHLLFGLPSVSPIRNRDSNTRRPSRPHRIYQRHGTTTLFAALNVLDGAVIAQCKPRHRHQEFLAFLRHIEANVPAQLDVHLVVDNYATHKHPKVRAWLARRPRWHIHFTPTYASWLNEVERFFALITQRAIRRDSFESTADLVKKIDRFIRTHNKNSRPFVWTAIADSILQKLARLCQRISGTQHLGRRLTPQSQNRWRVTACAFALRAMAKA
jgi:putative transposase